MIQIVIVKLRRQDQADRVDSLSRWPRVIPLNSETGDDGEAAARMLAEERLRIKSTCPS